MISTVKTPTLTPYFTARLHKPVLLLTKTIKTLFQSASTFVLRAKKPPVVDCKIARTKL